jgi:hypothetical protein
MAGDGYLPGTKDYAPAPNLHRTAAPRLADAKDLAMSGQPNGLDPWPNLLRQKI